MIKINKKLTNYQIIIPLIAFFIISVISIYSASKSMTNIEILKRQVMWYLIGFIIIILSSKLKLKIIIDYSFLIYIVINISLILLLFLGKEINGSKCWFILPGIGSIQPSEFMKLSIILINTKVFLEFDKKYPKRTFKTDIMVFFIILFITIIPSILTFIQPDTGIVIIYFLISFVMLFVFGIKKSLFLILFLIGLVILGTFFYFYFNYQDDFINVFGTSFFYRIDRILDWSSKSGMQLTNATTSIKAAGLLGFGFGKTPIYIPEAHTDFIFSVYASNSGFIGSLILIIFIVIFDTGLFKLARNTKDKAYRYIIIGFSSMILYQQIQNIGMNIGLLPITGITLPFISYGGSSLLSYMLGISLILNFDKKNK